MPPLFAVPVYLRREVPTDPTQLSGWLRTELSTIGRSIPPHRSRTVMTDDRIKATDWIVYVDATHGAFTLTLPSPDQVQDLVVTIKKTDNSGNAVTIGGTVDGVANRTLAAQYDGLTLSSDGVNYYILSTV